MYRRSVRQSVVAVMLASLAVSNLVWLVVH